MENQKVIESIIAWIKAHPLFKWSGMCGKLGVDKANFQKVMLSDTPKINPELIPKMIAELKKYGYVDGAAGLPLPADYVDTNKTGIEILMPDGGKVKFVPPISYKKATKKSFDGEEKKAKVTIDDLTKPTGKKVVSDPPPKTNVTINTIPVRMKGENSIDFAARKNEWKRKQK